MRKLVMVLLAVAALASAQAQQAPAPLPEWVSLHANIPYDHYKQTVLDIMQPKAASPKKRPGVLVIHGGGWVNGTKEAVVERHCLPYLEKGFVVANVKYRLAGVATAPAAVNDVLKAVQWFFQNAKRYNVDSKRIVVTGGSAGGHLSLMVGMTPESAELGKPAKVAAVVNFYGITDVADQLSGLHRRDYAVTWVPEQPGRLELAKRVSPMTYVRRGLPPILTIHGDADQTVPYQHGVRLTKALRSAGVDAELITVPGGRHGFSKGEMDWAYAKVFNFLERHGIVRQ